MPSTYLSADDFAAKVRFERATQSVYGDATDYRNNAKTDMMVKMMAEQEERLARELDDRRELLTPDVAKWLGISMAALKKAIQKHSVLIFSLPGTPFEKQRITMMFVKELEFHLTRHFGETVAQARKRIFAYTSTNGPGKETKQGKGLNLGTETKEGSQCCDPSAKTS